MPSNGASGQTTSVVVRVLAAVVIILGVSSALFAFSIVDVCNGHATDNGTVVSECRHLQLTDPPVVAVGVVILAALGAFFTEISGLGFALKRNVKDAQQTARNAEAAANSATDTAKSAMNQAEVAEHVSLGTASAANVTAQASGVGVGISDSVAKLAAEYNETRERLSPGRERTTQMTRLVSQMIAALSGIGSNDFDPSAYMSSDDRGLRLAGYAFLYANPDPRRTQELTAATVAEDKPFGQYWAIRALRKQLVEQPEALDLNSRRDLETLLVGLPAGSDRAGELRTALDARQGQ